MGILLDVLKELVGMFLADARLTIATLALVAIVATLVRGLGLNALAGGGILLAGCIAILIEAAWRQARRQD